MPSPSDDATRDRIAKLLSGGAINPPWTERALSQQTFDAIVRALQGLNPADLVGKLVISGFTLRPYVLKDDEYPIEHACWSCIYYERHLGFCNVPGLTLPVEPQWSCIVWRI
jgi:hypothetical protein